MKKKKKKKSVPPHRFGFAGLRISTPKSRLSRGLWVSRFGLCGYMYRSGNQLVPFSYSQVCTAWYGAIGAISWR